MDLGLKGKTAIVTGGASNIGFGITLTLAREGANVVIADIDEVQGEKVAARANKLGGGKVIQATCDATKWEQIQAVVKRTLDEFKGVDILVNNLGWTRDILFVEKELEEFKKEIDINLWSAIYCNKAVLPHMIEQKYGRIVSISSDSGLTGEYREAVYAACKAGIIGLSRGIAREVGKHGVTLNVVCPGVTMPENPVEEAGEKSMHVVGGAYQFMQKPEIKAKILKLYPMRKLGTPWDLANAVAFLASDCAGHITGQTFSVDGGYAMY